MYSANSCTSATDGNPAYSAARANGLVSTELSSTADNRWLRFNAASRYSASNGSRPPTMARQHWALNDSINDPVRPRWKITLCVPASRAPTFRPTRGAPVRDASWLATRIVGLSGSYASRPWVVMPRKSGLPMRPSVTPNRTKW